MKNNFVAKHANTYNKAIVQADKKRLAKKGYTKHKKIIIGKYDEKNI